MGRIFRRSKLMAENKLSLYSERPDRDSDKGYGGGGSQANEGSRSRPLKIANISAKIAASDRRNDDVFTNDASLDFWLLRAGDDSRRDNGLGNKVAGLACSECRWNEVYVAVFGMFIDVEERDIA
ncbi:hypothetical protein TNIN_174471 [Trichonephila inaurata madagascariensis]|uniref:Uncharacterized protein n=1 Tax=Trichonephila inaurata madagascariensis TaxID=2747483 RepID=A0A8X6YKX9_9ARAC|nr:hypothetical protein TNIN_174471 [Trichonephila inaurata madagascariensis]